MKRIALGLLCLLAAGLPAAGQQEALFSPFDDPEARALALLDQAQDRVLVAQYNIRNERFFDKLDELRQRGVTVRIVVDAKNAVKEWNTLDDRFEQAGFDITRYENTSSAYAIMHHKFTVIDDALVMTGSYNWNLTAQVTNDENMVVVRDPKLVAAYAHEFAELLGEAPHTPGPAVGQGGRVYFSPEDDVQDVIEDAIAGASTRVLVSVFTFRDDAIARALRDAANRGVEVWLITERKQADNTSADEIVAEAPTARVVVAANRSAAFSAMHHKFAVVDDTVITGACNWTYTAFRHSNEDVLLLNDPALVRAYEQAVRALVLRYAPDRFGEVSFGHDAPTGDAHVVISAPQLDRHGGGELFLVGEHPALGAWDPAQAIPLRTSDGLEPTWAASVELPAGATSAWKTIVKYADGSVVWETGPDRVLGLHPTGTDPATFAELGRASGATEVFRVTCAQPLPAGARLVIAGGDPNLGSWDPQAGLTLLPNADRTRWEGRARLPVGRPVSFKVVALDGDTATWETGDDHVVQVPAGAPWHLTELPFAPAPAAAPQTGAAGSIPQPE